MSYTLEDIKELRELMGAGIKDCKDALNASGGDKEKAKVILREKGAAKAEKKSVRQAQEGACYLHIAADKKSAVLVEVNCETDFVARPSLSMHSKRYCNSCPRQQNYRS